MKSKLSWLAALGALMALAGAGRDSSAAPPPAESLTPAPEPTPACALTTPTGGRRATCNLANFEAQVLALVNAYRTAGASCGGSKGNLTGAPPLAWNASLAQASLMHSNDMVARNFFSHTGPDGSNASQRAIAAGYIWQSVGENIAGGQPSVARVMAGWMASPGHCANIMQASFRDIGVACVSAGISNTYRTYWTMTLGGAS